MSSYRHRVVMFVMCLLGIPALAGAQPDSGCRQLPSTVHLDPMLRPVVADLLVRSTIVRRQCAIFQRVSTLRVDVQLVPNMPSTSRARATVHRFEFGLLRVVVEIPIGGNYAELIAHEFEHVIEQIERIDLAHLARTGSGEAAEVGTCVFETARARDAGLAVAAELDPLPDPAVRAVRSGLSLAARKTWRALVRLEPIGAPSSAQIGRK